MVLGTKQLDKLHTRECNIIKSALNLSTRLESSELMNSLRIERINEKVDIIFFFKNHDKRIYQDIYHKHDQHLS
jgi:hypothetical protein